MKIKNLVTFRFCLETIFGIAVVKATDEWRFSINQFNPLCSKDF